jgi:hypothetical protein
MEILGRIFATIGAGAVLTALTCVSLLIGVLVNGMIFLMTGRQVDRYLRSKGGEVWEPGSVQ